jgi:fructose-1,6-bisphosphatase/sedoheptulose 1,7-bisphosphatase-like protein
VGAALHIGKGDSNIVDQTALDFSRAVLNQTEIDGEVICCDGPKDYAPVFSRREKVGTCSGPKVEFVIDQVDGTTATSKRKKDAISALACAPAGCLQVLPDDGYYFKVATDGQSKGKISLDMSIEEIVQTVASPYPTRASICFWVLEQAQKQQSLQQLSSVSAEQCWLRFGRIKRTIRTDFKDSRLKALKSIKPIPKLSWQGEMNSPSLPPV